MSSLSTIHSPRQWLPHEKPMLPGSPSTPLHSPGKRVAYLIVGFIVLMAGGLSNALVSANLQNLQGSLGAYAAEMAWLPAAYVMSNVSMNLLLVKFRQEFGLRAFTEVFLVLYALVAFAHLFVRDVGSAIAVRAAHGMTGAALSSLGLYYMLQAFPMKYRMKGLVIALGVSQLALPLARVMPASVLEVNEWQGLYLFEFGLTILALGCVLLLKLPPGDRLKTFEKTDFLTFALFAPGMALLCGVLSLGRIVWWFEAPWIGYATAGSIVLLMGAFAIEHNRTDPLLNTRWMTSAGAIRFGLVMILIRIVLSEQSTGTVGLMQALGLSFEQMHPMFLAVGAGAVVGVAVSAMTLNVQKLDNPLVVALIAMIIGALMDANATNLTRPENMIVSQFLLAFGSSLFLAPALLSQIGGLISQPKNLVSFVVVFGISQNLGGLIGAALLGTVQTLREKFHSSQLTEHLTLLDPQVVSRIQSGSAAYGHVLNDPTLRGAEGSVLLATSAAREANLLAYNDVFMMIAAIAAVTLVFFVGHMVWKHFNPPAPAPVPATPAVQAPTSASAEQAQASAAASAARAESATLTDTV
ncbi:MFS transporter [soil metagenome]